MDRGQGLERGIGRFNFFFVVWDNKEKGSGALCFVLFFWVLFVVCH